MSECKHPVTHANPDGSVVCLVCGETVVPGYVQIIGHPGATPGEVANG